MCGESEQRRVHGHGHAGRGGGEVRHPYCARARTVLHELYCAVHGRTGRGDEALTHVVGDLRADAEGREGHDCEELRTASV
ncbi:MAG: hypothetical protein ACPIOQ_13380 [Promethearchaeia archaeon]